MFLISDHFWFSDWKLILPKTFCTNKLLIKNFFWKTNYQLLAIICSFSNRRIFEEIGSLIGLFLCGYINRKRILMWTICLGLWCNEVVLDLADGPVGMSVIVETQTQTGAKWFWKQEKLFVQRLKRWNDCRYERYLLQWRSWSNLVQSRWSNFNVNTEIDSQNLGFVFVKKFWRI